MLRANVKGYLKFRTIWTFMQNDTALAFFLRWRLLVKIRGGFIPLARLCVAPGQCIQNYQYFICLASLFSQNKDLHRVEAT